MVSTENKKYKVTHYNDLCYNPANLKFAVICLNKYGDAIFSPIYITFEIDKDVDVDFLGANLTRWDFINRALRFQQGTVYERMAVSPEDFLSIQCWLPSKAEQIRISSLVQTLDQRIDKQEKLVEALKKYKRGLLSSLFERCIRFKDNDGSEFPEWEQRKLISCCNGFDNLRQPITANLRRKGKYPYYGANGIQDYVDDYIFDGEYILLAEDGGHFDEFASKPIAQFICGRVWVNNHAHTSYTTQKKVYTEMIAARPDWELAGIYADEGICLAPLIRQDLGDLRGGISVQIHIKDEAYR